MMRLLTLASFFVAALGLCAAPAEPRAVAEAALQAWRDSDATTVNQLAHPELKKRLRTSRLLVFYLEQKKESTDVSALSDERVVALFCEAHRKMAPRDSRVEYFAQYISTEYRGSYAVVSFDSGWHSKTSPQSHRFREEVVLKKSGNSWRFLWSPAASLHVDFEWDPRKEEPSQSASSAPSNLRSP